MLNCSGIEDKNNDQGAAKATLQSLQGHTQSEPPQLLTGSCKDARIRCPGNNACICAIRIGIAMGDVDLVQRMLPGIM